MFAGESMVHRATDASKVALVALVSLLDSHPDTLIDVQWATPHLGTLSRSSSSLASRTGTRSAGFDWRKCRRRCSGFSPPG